MQSFKFKFDTSIDILINIIKKEKIGLFYSFNATRFNTLLSGYVTSINDMNGETNNGKIRRKIKQSIILHLRYNETLHCHSMNKENKINGQ